MPAGATSGPPTRRRGRPRSETSRRAILRAAGELLRDHDLGSISMDAVAARSGTGKATIYRWWPSKELLALDALLAEWEPAAADTRDRGALEKDLLALIRPWARRVAAAPYGRVLAALIAEGQSDASFAALYRERFLQPRRDPARTIFARAIQRGEIPARTDVEAAIDLLYGPLYHRMLHGHAPLGDRFTRQVVRAVVAAVGGAGQAAAKPAAATTA